MKWNFKWRNEIAARHFDIRHTANWPTDRPTIWLSPESISPATMKTSGYDACSAAMPEVQKCAEEQEKMNTPAKRKAMRKWLLLRCIFLSTAEVRIAEVCLIYSDGETLLSDWIELFLEPWAYCDDRRESSCSNQKGFVNPFNHMTVQVSCDIECQHRTRQDKARGHGWWMETSRGRGTDLLELRLHKWKECSVPRPAKTIK